MWGSCVSVAPVINLAVVSEICMTFRARQGYRYSRTRVLSRARTASRGHHAQGVFLKRCLMKKLEGGGGHPRLRCHFGTTHGIKKWSYNTHSSFYSKLLNNILQKSKKKNKIESICPSMMQHKTLSSNAVG